MFLRGLFSFRGCAQVACEVRACLNLVIEGKQTAARTRDRNYDNRVLDDDLLPPDLNATFATFVRGLNCSTDDPA